MTRLDSKTIGDLVARSRALHEAYLGEAELPPSLDLNAHVAREKGAQGIVEHSRQLAERYSLGGAPAA